MTVLNGNGVAGCRRDRVVRAVAARLPHRAAAGRALDADAPAHAFHTAVYFDAKRPGAKPAAQALARLFAPADVRPLPAAGRLRTLTRARWRSSCSARPSTTSSRPRRRRLRRRRGRRPSVRDDTTSGADLLQPLRKRVPFPLQTPTVLESSSYPDTCCGDRPVRLYYIAPHEKAVRLVFKTARSEYWGIEETAYDDAPVLADKSFRHSLGGREWDLYYSGSHLHMAVLRSKGATYWVVNTLLDSLSNETMLAIARGLKPLPRG